MNSSYKQIMKYFLELTFTIHHKGSIHRKKVERFFGSYLLMSIQMVMEEWHLKNITMESVILRVITPLKIQIFLPHMAIGCVLCN